MQDYDQEYLQLNRAVTGKTFTRHAAPEVEDNEKVKKKGMQGIGPSGPSSGIGTPTGTRRKAADGNGSNGNVPGMKGMPPAMVKQAQKRKAAAKNGNGKTNKWDPDNDGDDDSSPAGDTDHDHWTRSGKQKKSVPGKPMPTNGKK
jgi:hypothetical protein